MKGNRRKRELDSQPATTYPTEEIATPVQELFYSKNTAGLDKYGL